MELGNTNLSTSCKILWIFFFKIVSVSKSHFLIIIILTINQLLFIYIIWLVLHTDNSDRAVSRIVKKDNSIEKISLAWTLRANSTSQPFNILMFEEFKDSRPYMLNPKYSAPTSLPLYFFFGYQLFLESGLMEQCGPVSKESLLFRSLIKIIIFFLF